MKASFYCLCIYTLLCLLINPIILSSVNNHILEITPKSNVFDIVSDSIIKQQQPISLLENIKNVGAKGAVNKALLGVPDVVDSLDLLSRVNRLKNNDYYHDEDGYKQYSGDVDSINSFMAKNKEYQLRGMTIPAYIGEISFKMLIPVILTAMQLSVSTRLKLLNQFSIIIKKLGVFKRYAIYIKDRVRQSNQKLTKFQIKGAIMKDIRWVTVVVCATITICTLLMLFKDRYEIVYSGKQNSGRQGSREYPTAYVLDKLTGSTMKVTDCTYIDIKKYTPEN